MLNGQRISVLYSRYDFSHPYGRFVRDPEAAVGLAGSGAECAGSASETARSMAELQAARLR